MKDLCWFLKDARDISGRSLVAFESNDPIVNCSKDIFDPLESECKNLLRKCGIDNCPEI